MINEKYHNILIAIAWLSFNGYEVNKKRVHRYTGYSWNTVNKYFDGIYAQFLLDDKDRFLKSYKNYKGVNNE